MHLCYIDDSGDSRHGSTLTALIVEEQHWSGLLEAWLTGRRAIHQTFGVPKKRELHALELYKGRGKYCETEEDNARFGTNNRAAAGRMMLSALAQYEHFHVMTCGSAGRAKPVLYAQAIAKLEDWAEEHDTRIMVFYDGQQGLEAPGAEPGAVRQRELWETALRDAAPYRAVHRELPLATRRVIEDVVMQDSRYSQLIQAVDLIAYGAYQKHRQEHPEIWTTRNAVVPGAIRAYMRLAKQWSAGSDYGVEWLPG
jgi:hypothetical protein